MCASRLRTKQTSPTKHRATTGQVLDWPAKTYRYFYESNYPGSNECYHWFFRPYNVGWSNPDGSSWTTDDPSFHPNWTTATMLDMVIGLVPPMELNWHKLLTSSEYGLIQGLAELDDSIAIFRRKFWQEISYGSFTWGVLPFFSELNALVEQARNFNNRAADNLQQYEDQEVYSVSDTTSYPRSYGGTETVSINGQVTRRLTGYITIPYSPILEAYDRLGFHPDLATAWDLVPASFLVDVLLPIGEALEAYSDRGWIKAVNFRGWETIHYEGTFSPISRQGGPYDGHWDCSHDFEIFIRKHHMATVLIDRPDRIDPSFEVPPLYVLIQNLLNWWYVFGRGKNRDFRAL